MAQVNKTIPADSWELVLENVTNTGQVFIKDLNDEPTAYYIAVVPTGDPAPASDFDAGIKFGRSFSPAQDTASDFYVFAEGLPGKVTVLT